jgi:hypothetical protein
MVTFSVYRVGDRGLIRFANPPYLKDLALSTGLQGAEKPLLASFAYAARNK